MVRLSTGEPAHVGDDDCVELPFPSIVKKGFKTRPLDVRAGLALVHVLANQDAALRRNVLPVVGPMRVDSGEVTLGLVVAAATQVDGVPLWTCAFSCQAGYSQKGFGSREPRSQAHRAPGGTSAAVQAV